MSRREPIANGALLFYGAERRGEAGEPLDKILVELDVTPDEQVLIRLPQFGVEAWGTDPPDALGEVLLRALSLRPALAEAGDDYIGRVEEHQIELLDTVLLPWLEGLFTEQLTEDEELIRRVTHRSDFDPILVD